MSTHATPTISKTMPSRVDQPVRRSVARRVCPIDMRNFALST